MKASRASRAGPRASDSVEGQESAVGGRPWVAPALQRLAASEAERHPGAGPDAEMVS